MKWKLIEWKLNSINKNTDITITKSIRILAIYQSWYCFYLLYMYYSIIGFFSDNVKMHCHWSLITLTSLRGWEGCWRPGSLWFRVWHFEQFLWNDTIDNKQKDFKISAFYIILLTLQLPCPLSTLFYLLAPQCPKPATSLYVSQCLDLTEPHS